MALASKWLRQRRLWQVIPFLEPPVLDIGCGDCASHEYTSGYVGIDRDRAPLAGRPYLQKLQGSAERLPFQDHSFKTVLAMAVLEHVDDPAACLGEALRVLKPSGRLVLTTPTPFGDRIHHMLAYANITSKHAAEEHQSVMSPADLRNVVEAAGFTTERFRLFLLGGNQACVASPRNAAPGLAAGARTRWRQAARGRS